MPQKKYESRRTAREPVFLILAAALVSAAIGLLTLVADLAEHPSVRRIVAELAFFVPLVAWLAWRKRSDGVPG